MSSGTRGYLPPRGNWLAILLEVLSLAGLYAVSRYDFLVFHCLTEAFSIIIAIAVFAIFWNTRQFHDNGIYLVLGLGCLFGGVFDIIYIFAYEGMSVFPGADGNIALQAKTVAQWYVSLSCVFAFPFLRRKVDQNIALLVYSALLALAVASIFYWQVFPECLAKGARMTRFERIGLVVSCSAYLGALVLLVSNQREFDRHVFKLLAATLITFFVQDFACAVATELNGFARTIAHLCQVVALYFVYKAFVEVGLTKPYDLLFRRQQQSAEALQRERRTLRHLLRSSDHERQLIAYEIHDGLAQYLAGAIMQLDTFQHLKEAKPQEAAKAYDAGMMMLRSGHREARRLISGVRPPILDEEGIVAAIAHLVNESGLEQGPRVEFRSRVKFKRLVPALESAIYRIVQEGLTNACKHSKSERVRISLLQRQDRLRITIRDWGIGFVPAGVEKERFGLEGMRERARLLGGSSAVQSVPGRGTRITVELPVVLKEEGLDPPQ